MCKSSWHVSRFFSFSLSFLFFFSLLFLFFFFSLVSFLFFLSCFFLFFLSCFFLFFLSCFFLFFLSCFFLFFSSFSFLFFSLVSFLFFSLVSFLFFLSCFFSFFFSLVSFLFFLSRFFSFFSLSFLFFFFSLSFLFFFLSLVSFFFFSLSFLFFFSLSRFFFFLSRFFFFFLSRFFSYFSLVSYFSLSFLFFFFSRFFSFFSLVSFLFFLSFLFLFLSLVSFLFFLSFLFFFLSFLFFSFFSLPGEENETVRSSSCTSCKTPSPCCTTTCTSCPCKDNACVSSSVAPASSRAASLAPGSSPHSLPPLYVGHHRSHHRLNEAVHSGRADSKEMDAPEGSAVNTPPYTETDATTPPYLKWAENLDYLLVDSDGVSLFQTFLTQEHGAATTLEFWFACQGLKNRARSAEEIPHLIKVIHKKFLRGDSIPFISMETKKELAERLKKSVTLDQSVFDSAQEEVLNYIRIIHTLYFKVRSVHYNRAARGKSPKGSSNSSSGSNSIARVRAASHLPEDQELNTNTVSQSHSVIPGPLVKPPSSCRYSRPESSWRTETITG
ncbi:AXIN1 [Acanthosepion pharaonis]|uniref:AXIN1 n=1 Tax=Acanthosepion pharaonis TaxID=158019 RepID=A0A812ASC4_ACAPH|nr:AXIN1 [Sepia pharaonis]